MDTELVRIKLFPSYRFLIISVATFAVAILHGLYQNSLNFALVCMINTTKANTTVISVCNRNVSDGSRDYGNEGTFSWSPNDQAILISAFSWGAAVSIIPVAILTDKIGPRLILIPSLVLSTMASLLTPLSAENAGLIGVFVCRFVNGFCGACSWPCATRTVQNWALARDRLVLVGIVSTGFPLGQFFSNFFAGYICKYLGWSYIFYGYGGVGVVHTIIMTVLYSSYPEENRCISERELGIICSDKDRGVSTSNREKSTKVPWMSVMTSLPVWATIAGTTATVNIQFFINSFMPIYFHEAFGVRTVLNGIFSSLPSLVTMFGRPLAGLLADFSMRKGTRWSETVTAKLFETVGLGGSMSVLCFINILTCNQSSIAAVVITIQSFLGSFVVGGHSRCLMTIAPGYTGIITGLASLGAYVSTIITPYATRTITVNGTMQEWRIVFGITIGFIAFCNLMFVLFASSKRQKWA